MERDREREMGSREEEWVNKIKTAVIYETVN